MPDRLNGTERTDAALLASGTADGFVEVCRRHGPRCGYPGAPAGAVLGYETIVSTGVADSTQARP